MTTDRPWTESRVRPQLLVSVRNASEAEQALRGGCDILDVKDPARGPLGMAAASALSDIWDRLIAWNRQTGRTIPISAALGEPRERMRGPPPAGLPPLDYVKLGTAGLADAGANWPQAWRKALRRALVNATGALRPVIVAYADAAAAAAPSPAEVIAQSARLGVSGVLIDTWNKREAWLGGCLPPDELIELAESAASQGVAFGLAGGLRRDRLNVVQGLRVDVVGIRGAACLAGDRSGSICEEAVSAFHRALRQVLGNPLVSDPS